MFSWSAENLDQVRTLCLSHNLSPVQMVTIQNQVKSQTSVSHSSGSQTL